MLRVAALGYGYWGPNIVRALSLTPGVEPVAVVDRDAGARRKAAAMYPAIQTFENDRAVLADPDVDAVVVSLPTELHFDAARRALDAGKHVFVEKPLCLRASDAQKLAALADAAGKTLMVGHLLMYHPGIVKLKQLVRSNRLGRIRYIYTQRLNLGMIRTSENALQSLAPHDISVILYLLEDTPTSVTAMGESYLHGGVEDTVFAHLKFKDRVMAHLHVSWLDPHKVRRITVVGDRRMAVFDDMRPSEKLRVFDKGVEPSQAFTNFGEVLSLRFGDINSPALDTIEPLRAEIKHFADCVSRHKTPRSDGKNGLAVVRVLEAAQKSLKSNGRAVVIKK